MLLVILCSFNEKGLFIGGIYLVDQWGFNCDRVFLDMDMEIKWDIKRIEKKVFCGVYRVKIEVRLIYFN